MEITGIGRLYGSYLEGKHLLEHGPSLRGLFGEEGRRWARLKQDEPVINYATQKVRSETAVIIDLDSREVKINP